MMPMLICLIYSNLLEMFVQLYTALSVQHVMICLVIYQTVAFHLLVTDGISAHKILLLDEVDTFESSAAFQLIMQD